MGFSFNRILCSRQHKPCITVYEPYKFEMNDKNLNTFCHIQMNLDHLLPLFIRPIVSLFEQSMEHAFKLNPYF